MNKNDVRQSYRHLYSDAQEALDISLECVGGSGQEQCTFNLGPDEEGPAVSICVTKTAHGTTVFEFKVNGRNHVYLDKEEAVRKYADILMADQVDRPRAYILD